MERQKWDKRHSGTEIVWSAEPNRQLVCEVKGLVPGRALDVACGQGRNALWLAEMGWQVVAIDFSSVAVARGQQIAAARGIGQDERSTVPAPVPESGLEPVLEPVLEIDWLVADVCRYRPQPGYFDLVIVMYLHMPWSEMQLALDHAATAVGPGGSMVIIGHDRSNLELGHGGPRDPAVLYSADQVSTALVATIPDATIVKAEPVERHIEPAGDRVTHWRSGADTASCDAKPAIDCLVHVRRAG